MCIIGETFFITSSPPILGVFCNTEKNILFTDIEQAISQQCQCWIICKMQKNVLCYQMHQNGGGDNVLKACPRMQWSLPRLSSTALPSSGKNERVEKFLWSISAYLLKQTSKVHFKYSYSWENLQNVQNWFRWKMLSFSTESISLGQCLKVWIWTYLD